MTADEMQEKIRQIRARWIKLNPEGGLSEYVDIDFPDEAECLRNAAKDIDVLLEHILNLEDQLDGMYGTLG